MGVNHLVGEGGGGARGGVQGAVLVQAHQESLQRSQVWVFPMAWGTGFAYHSMCMLSRFQEVGDNIGTSSNSICSDSFRPYKGIRSKQASASIPQGKRAHEYSPSRSRCCCMTRRQQRHRQALRTPYRRL